MENQEQTTEKLEFKFLDTEVKPPQQREQELHQEQLKQEEQAAAEVIEAVVEPIELKDEDVFGYLGKKLNKTIASYDDLVVEKVVEKDVELPEDVNAFFKFKKETGRGLNDFINLTKEYSNDEELLRDFYTLNEEGLDSEDINGMVGEFALLEIDEDLDTEEEIKQKKDTNRKKNLSKKKAINEAKKFFETRKDQYKVPLESSMASLSDEEKNEFAEYKQYKSQADQDRELVLQKGKVFEQKTNEVFNDGFKGFEFDLDGKSITFKPADALELKNSNSSPMNLIGKFLDKDGFIADPIGYHRALTVATFPERFAKHFYEQGKADATNDVLKDIKNTDMGERKTPQGAGKAGLQVKFLNEEPKFGIKG